MAYARHDHILQQHVSLGHEFVWKMTQLGKCLSFTLLAYTRTSNDAHAFRTEIAVKSQPLHKQHDAFSQSHCEHWYRIASYVYDSFRFCMAETEECPTLPKWASYQLAPFESCSWGSINIKMRYKTIRIQNTSPGGTDTWRKIFFVRQRYTLSS